MIRRVVFAGGVQVKALAKAYRLDIAAELDEDVFFIPSEAMSREAAHRVVAAADVLITDVSEHGATVPDGLLPPSAQRIAVPVILADFLWPFAGQPHPRNAGTAALKEGPYPAAFGDSYLDRLAAEGLPEDMAVERYMAADIANLVDLDMIFRRRMEIQQELDSLTGCEVASFIEEEFRSLNLFAAIDRLRLPLFRHVAATVFSRMGIEPLRAAALLEAPFPSGAMPIHPSILRHFGMEVPRPDHRYGVLDEGFFTFEQYCRRYLRYDWNEELHIGIALAETNPAEAIRVLQAALERSPGSRAGQRALEDAERAVAETARQERTLALPPATNSALPPPAVPQPARATAVALPSPPLAAPALPPALPSVQLSPTQLLPTAPRPWQDPPGALGGAAVPMAPPAWPPAGPPPSPVPPNGVYQPDLPQEAPWRAVGHAPLPFTPGLPEASPPNAPPSEPQFAPAGLSSVRFSSSKPEISAPRPEPSNATVSLVAAPPARPAGRELALSPEPQEPTLPEPQSYVELPRGPISADPPPALPLPNPHPGKYVPLAPDDDLIEVLPRMLPSTRGQASLANIPFAQMPETMPPPPLRPVLPPELHAEPVKRSFVDKLLRREQVG